LFFLFTQKKGEPTELLYILSGYGVPVDLLPVTHSGTVKTANHLRCIKALRAQEKNIDNDDKKEVIVECPRSYDVVIRKGPTYKNSRGNLYYRELIESSNDQHSKANSQEKYEITWRIVKAIDERNGRFLEWSTSRKLWIVVTDRDIIRKKIAACYKQYNRSSLARQEQDAAKNIKKDHTIKIKEQHMPQQAKSQLDNAIANATAVTEEINFANTLSINLSMSKTRQVLQPSVSQYGDFPKDNSEDGSVSQYGDFPKDNSEDGSLKHYYSLQHAYNPKRRKTSLFCGYNPSEKKSGSNGCVGLGCVGFCFNGPLFPK